LNFFTAAIAGILAATATPIELVDTTPISIESIMAETGVDLMLDAVSDVMESPKKPKDDGKDNLNAIMKGIKSAQHMGEKTAEAKAKGGKAL